MENKTTTTKRGKENGYKSDTLWRRRAKRAEEAHARQLKYNSLTKKEKIAIAKSRGGSKREIAKLEKA
jgi:hypothetical protein